VVTQAGRFDTEEDVLRYMLDPFPWLLMAVYQLNQEHKVAGSVVEASAKTLQQSGRSVSEDSAATTDGESTSHEDTAKKKWGRLQATVDDASVKKGKGKKGKGGHGPKKSDSAQKDKTIAMLKMSLAKAQAENGKGEPGSNKLKAQSFDGQLRRGPPVISLPILVVCTIPVVTANESDE
jgi:hypothetical protein